MAFRSTVGFRVLGCTLLVPFALACSSDGKSGGPASSATLPNQPGAAPEGMAPPGTADGQAVPSPSGAGEGLPGNLALGEGGVPSENIGAACDVSAAELTAANTNLPDPFTMHDGTRLTTKAQWACRRNEIKKDIERFEIGTKPEPPTVNATLDGGTLNVLVTTGAGSITLSSNVVTVDGDAPHCVAIGMGGNSSLINGCVEVPFMYNQVVNLNYMGMIDQNDPFYTVYPELRGKIANYAAWSWGISRIIDGLDQVKDQLNVDMSKIGVHGCSASGKMALFGGALDERVALTLVQESGGGGINSWRLSKAFVDRTGVQIEKIDNTNYSWFLQSMQALNPDTLPHDHHELIAMIAPRAVAIFGNRDQVWLGDESGYKSTIAAQEVWKALGAEANFGYDFTTGHPHCQADTSQTNTANTFVNKFLLGQDADTKIAIPTTVNGYDAMQAVYDLDETKVMDWQTPSLQ